LSSLIDSAIVGILLKFKLSNYLPRFKKLRFYSIFRARVELVGVVFYPCDEKMLVVELEVTNFDIYLLFYFKALIYLCKTACLSNVEDI
jgi:hypothetical protein